MSFLFLRSTETPPHTHEPSSDNYVIKHAAPPSPYLLPLSVSFGWPEYWVRRNKL